MLRVLIVGIAGYSLQPNEPSDTERYDDDDDDDDDDDAGYGLNRNFKSNFLGEKIPQTTSVLSW